MVYPHGEEGDHEVALELVINADGSVRSAAALDKDDNAFTRTATKQALRWRFYPAERNGEPVAARVRFLVTFSQQEVVDEANLDETPAATPSATTAEDAPLEVLVLGELEYPATKTLSRAEAKKLPGAFDDPLRAVDVLPGVTPIFSALPLFFVRGAPPANVGFFLDGVRIPLLYHAFLGPSVLHPALIERVNLHASAFPVEYGRFAGAVVAAELAKPERRFRGEGNVRIVDAGATLEVPFDEQRGSAWIGGRYSYTSLILSRLTGNTLAYWDYQGLLSYDLSPNDELSLLTFGALDFLDGGTEESYGGTSFHRVDLRWDHDYSPRTRSRLAATWGLDRTLSLAGSLDNFLLAARGQVVHRRGQRSRIRAGFDVSRDAYSLDLDRLAQDYNVYAKLFPTRTDFAAGAYVDATFDPHGWFSVTPGIRMDVFDTLGVTEIGIDPRLAASFDLGDGYSVNHILGVSHQLPNFIPAIPGAQVGGLEGGLQRTVHSASGVEFPLPLQSRAGVTAFQNVSFGLTDPAGLTQEFGFDEDSQERRATGHAYGLEVFLRRSLSERWGGLISYTLSRTTRSYAHIRTVNGYDRTHVVNAALSYDLGAGFRAGLRALGASGIPGSRDLEDGKIFDGGRSRPFVRLDGKIEKRWQLSGGSWLAASAEMLNATASTEVIRRVCFPRGCDDEAPPSIYIPSVGVEGGF